MSAEDMLTAAAMRRVLEEPEFGDWKGLCVTADWPKSPKAMSPELLDRLDDGPWQFSTGPACSNTREVMAMRVSPITSGRGVNGITIRFMCGPHGCYRADETLVSDTDGWRVATISLCDEAGPMANSRLEACLY
jgi:hypothetical protein